MVVSWYGESTEVAQLKYVSGCGKSTIECADTPPTPAPTQNDLLVAMHMVYLVLLIVALFRYVDEQSTL